MKRLQKCAFKPTKAVRYQRTHQPAFQGLILSEALWREATGNTVKPDPSRGAALAAVSLFFHPNKHCPNGPLQASAASMEGGVQVCVCVHERARAL